MEKIPKIAEILRRKYLKDFDPRHPSVGLVDAIAKARSPKNASLSQKLRDVSLSELPMDTIEYIAYELNFRATITKIYAKFQYYILMYENLNDLGLDDDDFRDAVKEEFGITLSLSNDEVEYKKHMDKNLEKESYE